jgi:exodeoxyribonuclease V alpha subunit
VKPTRFLPPPLSPLGTARQRLDPAAGGGGYPTDLLPQLREVDLGEEALFLAWQLASWAAGLDGAGRRALTGLIVRALVSAAQGSTRLPLDVALGAAGAAAARALIARAPEVVGAPGARRPFILDGGCLYQQRLLASEDRLAAALRARAAAAPLASEEDAARAVAAVLDSARPRPTDEQAAAVRAALVRPLTVVSGGPGTGKTTIVLAIVRALMRLGLPVEAVALAAPTGKAANRLEEAIAAGMAGLGALGEPDRRVADARPEAQTLHRLLGYSPSAGAFRHHQNNRLAQKVVVVDECSMIDLPLMERLARAVPDDGRLILLGDADQLASVGAGAVFRDLTPLGLRLGRSHRVKADDDAGRRLRDLAAAVRDGAGDALAALFDERPSARDLRYQGAELLPAAARDELYDRWHAERIAAHDPQAELRPREGGGDDAAPAAPFRLEAGRFGATDEARLDRIARRLQSARILCVTRGGPTGTQAANEALHRRHGGDAGALAPGEPVMMLRNDYDRGLYNGDQGVVVRLREDRRAPRLGAAFPTRAGWAAWPIDAIGESLELSFAMTVHKAQGSELDVVALLLPEQPIPLLSRELLYTALTRARRAAVVCGSAAVLAAGAAAKTERSSGLAEKLRA